MILRLKLRMFFVLVLAFGGLGGAGLSVRGTDFDDNYDYVPNFNTPPPDRSLLNADKVNRAFGISLVRGPSLWNEKDEEVADRLRWPEESRTSTESSYRIYSGGTLKILGEGTYSCALYASHNKPTEIAIFFMNRGDYNWHANEPQPTVPGQPVDPYVLGHFQDETERAFEKGLKEETQALSDKLTALFGRQPAHQDFGGAGRSERALRWDWQGHSFLLSTSDNQYIALRIAPIAFANSFGQDTISTRPDLIATLLNRVKRSDSGDVVITDIPMVDQGPKGYCVPATWERYMRYLGIPVDMYVLAVASGTSSGGGTGFAAMASGAYDVAASYHRRVEMVPGPLDIKNNIAISIDRGIPLIWACGIYGSEEDLMNDRIPKRRAVTDWQAWTDSLVKDDVKEIPAIQNSQDSIHHQRLIIGYNEKTDEIAVSDSWSNAYAIRWMTVPEANAISLGDIYVIKP
ncbi:MAG TPA: hypothetical protein VGZ93_08745 [Candidatus Methylacidiphilales bacterium]|jgi:hypothetical protein|nr:hypothetical protein [Candidatus Methylacidiphilales bacterium]